jgi:hypothetical protein
VPAPKGTAVKSHGFDESLCRLHLRFVGRKGRGDYRLAQHSQAVGILGDLYPGVSDGDEVSEYDLVNPPTTRDLLKKASVIVSCADAGG